MDEALAVEALSGQGQIHAVGLDVHPEAEIGAAVILHDVLQHRAAAADAVHIDVLLRDLDVLGAAHELLIRRPSMCDHVKTVRSLNEQFRRQYAVSHAVFIDRQLHAAAHHAEVIPECLVQSHARRRCDGEFVVLLRADHIRAVDRDGEGARFAGG